MTETLGQLTIIRDGDDCLVDDLKRGQLYIRHPMDRFPEIVMAGKISLPNKWRKYRPVSRTNYVSACCTLGVTVTPVRLEIYKTGWRTDVENAPKDGTRIIVGWEDTSSTTQAHYDTHANEWCDDDGCYLLLFTHWMLIPALPEVTG